MKAKKGLIFLFVIHDQITGSYGVPHYNITLGCCNQLSAYVDLRVSKQVIRLILPVKERLLILLGEDPADAWDVPQGARLDVSSEPDDIQDYKQGDSQQAGPDNVVRVEVSCGQVLVGVAVVHPVVDVLLLAVSRHQPDNYTVITHHSQARGINGHNTTFQQVEL